METRSLSESFAASAPHGQVAGGQSLALIEEITSDARKIFEHVLTSSFGRAETRGACMYASIMLATLLSKFAEAPSHVCGGGPPMDGGLVDLAGVLRGHYWVEGMTGSGEAFVADITADQFGYSTIVVLPLAAAARYQRGDQSLINQHIEEERQAWKAEGLELM